MHTSHSIQPALMQNVDCLGTKLRILSHMEYKLALAIQSFSSFLCSSMYFSDHEFSHWLAQSLINQGQHCDMENE